MSSGLLKAAARKRISTGDPYFSSVVLLMHMEGSDGGTTFTDVKGKTVTPLGIVTTEVEQYKFGAASAYFSGSSPTLRLADSNDFNFGAGDFTIEMFIRPTGAITAGSYLTMYLQRAGGSSDVCLGFWVAGTEKYYIAYSANGTSATGVSVGGSLPTVNVWSHLALCREGVNLRVFLDGVQQGSTHNIGTTTLYNSSHAVDIGCERDFGRYPFNGGYIDEYRVTKGVARYTANFTPPSAQFPDS